MKIILNVSSALLVLSLLVISTTTTDGMEEIGWGVCEATGQICFDLFLEDRCNATISMNLLGFPIFSLPVAVSSLLTADGSPPRCFNNIPACHSLCVSLSLEAVDESGE